jgi:hypothetical protein
VEEQKCLTPNGGYLLNKNLPNTKIILVHSGIQLGPDKIFTIYGISLNGVY